MAASAAPAEAGASGLGGRCALYCLRSFARALTLLAVGPHY